MTHARNALCVACHERSYPSDVGIGRRDVAAIGGAWLVDGTGLGFCQHLCPRLLIFAAVSRIGGGQMAMLSPVETLMSIVWSSVFLDERLSPLQWVGGAFVLTSAVLALQRLEYCAAASPLAAVGQILI